MSPNSSSESEKKNIETEQRSVDNSTQENQTEKKKDPTPEEQKQVDADKTKSTTETLLADLDKEVVSDVYTEKTKKEMLTLRDDVSAGRIDAKNATEKLEDLKKEKQDDTKQKEDADLTLRQETKKWLFMTFLPF